MKPRNNNAAAVVEEPAASHSAAAETTLSLERRKLLEELASLESLPTDELAEGWQDAGSASEDTSREIEYGHRDALHRRLLHINEALERLTTGQYGLCVRCNSQIRARRLEADPAALLCLRCQAFIEGDFKSKSL
jgi:DnaK suppressor protein